MREGDWGELFERAFVLLSSFLFFFSAPPCLRGPKNLVAANGCSKYTVADRTYSSSRYSFSKTLKAASREHAEVLRKPYLAGSETIAYYDPADPGRSVLVRGWRGISLIAVELGGVIASLGVAVFARIVWDKWAGKGRSKRRAMAKRHK